MNNDTWILKEQLDTPLNEVFPGTKTNGTARLWVIITEFALGIVPANLDEMSYEELNRYIDSLDEKVMQLNIQ